MNGKRKASAVLLLLCLALSALPASAADEALVNGANAFFDDISGNVYESLASMGASVPAASAGSSWNCAVTCSAEVVFDGLPNLPGLGALGILDDGVVVPGSERLFEMQDNPGVNDVGRIVVSTTAKTTMSNSSDPDTFACAARELLPGIDIANSSISFVCTDLP